MPRARWTGTCFIKRSRKNRSTWLLATRPTAGSPHSTWSSSTTIAATFPPTRPFPWFAPRRSNGSPNLREVFNLLAGKIDATAMRQMNREVDQERKSPEQVAHNFLVGKGLLPED